MDTGTKISVGAHGLLLLGVLVGNPFGGEPEPFTVQEVSVISSAEFDALTSSAPAAPESAAPEISPPAAEADPPPAPVQPAPDEDVAALAPPVSPPPPALPEPEPALDPGPEPVPQAADRVAPEAVPEPEAPAVPDPVEQEAVTADAPDPAADVEPTPPQEATAPEAATTEIVTEADVPSAPTQSPRPPARPTRTTEAPAPAPDPAPTETAEEDAIAAAISDAVAAVQSSPSLPVGPPLTGGEREGLRVAVSSCWNVGALSTEAQETRVTVFVAMNQDGTPRGDSIRMTSFDGGSEAAAERVYETARRAILRCGARGFPLPADKYGQWQEIEMTFNPEGMFWR